MSQRYFEGAEHAAIYALFRPTPPLVLVKKIISYLKEKNAASLDLCFDVGCGNGQASLLFASNFSKVIATDISDSQIQAAKSGGHPKNVEFMVSPAEKISTESETVQLVSSVQACHWFDLAAFFQEVDRVLCNNGVIALSGYDPPTVVHPTKSEQLNEVLLSFFCVRIDSYFGPGYTLLKNSYRDISLPFKDCVRDEVWTDEGTVTLSFIVKEFCTSSGFQNYCAAEGEAAGKKLSGELISKFQTILETEEHPDRVELKMKYKYFVIMGRKTVNL